MRFGPTQRGRKEKRRTEMGGRRKWAPAGPDGRHARRSLRVDGRLLLLQVAPSCGLVLLVAVIEKWPPQNGDSVQRDGLRRVASGRQRVASGGLKLMMSVRCIQHWRPSLRLMKRFSFCLNLAHCSRLCKGVSGWGRGRERERGGQKRESVRGQSSPVVLFICFWRFPVGLTCEKVASRRETK